MPTNLYDAHKQWASHPAGERFENLESLQTFKTCAFLCHHEYCFKKFC